MKKKLCYLLITSIAAIALFGCTKEEVNETAETTSAEQESTTMQEESDEQETSTEMETATEETTTKHEHDYKEEIINATCGKKGNKIFTCTSCKDTYSEEIPALEHSYNVTSVSNATCTSKGSKVYTCSICVHSYTEELPIVGHNWKAATCTTPKTCLSCNLTEGSKLNHNGNGSGYCSICGIQIYVKEYTYEFSIPKSFNCLTDYYRDGELTNTVYFQNIVTSVDNKCNNPAILTISFLAEVTYQDPFTVITSHHAYIVLKDFNGNEIGKKEVDILLGGFGSKVNSSVQFQVSPGNYYIEFENFYK